MARRWSAETPGRGPLEGTRTWVGFSPSLWPGMGPGQLPASGYAGLRLPQELPGGAGADAASRRPGREAEEGATSSSVRAARGSTDAGRAPLFLPVLAHAQLPQQLGSRARNEPTEKRRFSAAARGEGGTTFALLPASKLFKGTPAEPGALSRPVRSRDICPLGAVTRPAAREENVMGEMWGEEREGSPRERILTCTYDPIRASSLPKSPSTSVSYESRGPE